MKKVWVVVANSGLAKVFLAEDNKRLVEIKVMEHKEAHMKREELVSDSKGRTTQSSYRHSDTKEDPTSIRVKEANIFAREISQFLEEGFNKNECDHLYLISKSPFLGHLREVLSANILKIIAAEIPKDLTLMRPEEIREYLPFVL